jgi:NOL1/NOP2/fmu family ribosome biogenesis protein
VVPREHAGFVDFLGSRVGVLYKGCEVWSRGRPAHALAMWDGLAREGTRRWEVDLPTALRYLRREEVRLDAPAGEWIIVTYGSLPLGWVKAVGGRLNNYYPAAWRLRMGGGGVGEKGVS